MTQSDHYVRAATDNSFHFDAELIETVINKMKLGKAAGLDGLTAEHLHYCNSILPCVLSKQFNCMMAIGRAYLVWPCLEVNPHDKA